MFEGVTRLFKKSGEEAAQHSDPNAPRTTIPEGTECKGSPDQPVRHSFQKIDDDGFALFSMSLSNGGQAVSYKMQPEVFATEVHKMNLGTNGGALILIGKYDKRSKNEINSLTNARGNLLIQAVQAVAEAKNPYPFLNKKSVVVENNNLTFVQTPNAEAAFAHMKVLESYGLERVTVGSLQEGGDPSYVILNSVERAKITALESKTLAQDTALDQPDVETTPNPSAIELQKPTPGGRRAPRGGNEPGV